MINHLNLRNFKAWGQLDIKLGRITGLFGTNSSGKSSLIQFLLMLKQTKNNPDRGMTLDFGEYGQLVDLGGFRDLIHRNNDEVDLEWTLDWGLEKTLRIQDATKKNKESITVTNNLKLKSAVGYNKERRFLQTRYICYDTGEIEFCLTPNNEGDGFTLNPDRNSESKFSFIRTQGRAWALPGPIKTHLFPDQSKTFYQNSEFLGDLEFAYEKFLDRVFYLGPLRAYPRRQYNWTGSSPTDVGRQGEQTMNAILAATANGQKRSTKKKGHRKPFQEVIASHLKTMGLIEHFSVVEVAAGSNIYQTKVKRDKGGTEALLTDVGFGVSQVLPAIVLLHYVPEGSTVIFEQPEIHLHPAVQSHLADAIIDISESRNLQVILESHSEHLLRRLQRRVAEERLPADWIKLYFVDQVKGEARLSDIGLNDF